MNLDEYRAIKNQTEGNATNAQTEHQPTQTVEQNVSQTPEVPASPESLAVQETATKIKFGEQEYDVEQLVQAKQQADSLALEQERLKDEVAQANLAQQYFNKMMENPTYAETFAQNNGLQYVDPNQQKIQALEKQYNKVLLDQEISNLKTKYDDFNQSEVVKFAVDSGIKNLEDAYLLKKTKSAETVAKGMDANAIKEQIRQEILNELRLEVNTTSLIGAGTGGMQTQASAPQLTPAELNVAKRMKMTPEEYLKFKQ